MIDKIESALSSIGLPVFDFFFDHTKKYKNAQGELIDISEYITYSVISETPVIYADDEDDYTQLTIDVNCFTPIKANADTYKLRIRDSLRNAGFIIDETVLQYEYDTRYYHTTVTVLHTEKTEHYTAPNTL